MHGLGVRDGKDVDHSVDHCEYTKEIWQSILGLTSGKDKWNEDSLLECMKKWFDEKALKQYRAISLIVPWAIWLTRNASIF